MNYSSVIASASGQARALNKQCTDGLASARQQVANASAAISSDINTLTQANLGLANTLHERRTKLQDLEVMQAKLLEVTPDQDNAIKELTEEVQKLQIAMKKSDEQFEHFKNLVEQTKQAVAGSTTAIEALNQNLDQAKGREAETQRRFEDLKEEFLGLHDSIQSSGNDRLKTLQELQEQNVMLSRFLSQCGFINETAE